MLYYLNLPRRRGLDKKEEYTLPLPYDTMALYASSKRQATDRVSLRVHVIVAAVIVRGAFVGLLTIPLHKTPRHLQNNVARQFFEVEGVSSPWVQSPKFAEVKTDRLCCKVVPQDPSSGKGNVISRHAGTFLGRVGRKMLVCEAHVETGRVDPIHVDMEEIRVMLGQSDDVLFALKPSIRAGDLEERRMRAK
ncbi:hypothetical protein KC333_g7 [Hortaea werneckii]|nr:hypothetical protein KC333_g7 [Hortaea werneckii]